MRAVNSPLFFKKRPSLFIKVWLKDLLTIGYWTDNKKIIKMAIFNKRYKK